VGRRFRASDRLRPAAELIEPSEQERPNSFAVAVNDYWNRGRTPWRYQRSDHGMNQLGETGKAMELLEDAYRAHSIKIEVNREPALDPLRSDPRFIDLLRRMGLPQ